MAMTAISAGLGCVAGLWSRQRPRSDAAGVKARLDLVSPGLPPGSRYSAASELCCGHRRAFLLVALVSSATKSCSCACRHVWWGF